MGTQTLWTATPPSKPGWYWCRPIGERNPARWQMELITETLSMGLIFDSDGESVHDATGYEFSREPFSTDTLEEV